MPSKLFLEQLTSNKSEKFSTILEYSKNSLPIQKIKYIKILANGQKEICLENTNNELFVGIGDNKIEALSECVSLKYPS